MRRLLLIAALLVGGGFTPFPPRGDVAVEDRAAVRSPFMSAYPIPPPVARPAQPPITTPLARALGSCALFIWMPECER